MKNLKKYVNDRGFTLIELLVVVAIIGILASVILVSLSSARNKARDARIISDVQQIRTQIESDSSGSNYSSSFIPVQTYIGMANANGNTTRYYQLASDAANNESNATAQANALCTVGNQVQAVYSLANFGWTANTCMNNSALIIESDGNGNGAGGWNATPTKYAIFGALSTGNYFCIDSTGNTKNPTGVAVGSLGANYTDCNR